MPLPIDWIGEQSFKLCSWGDFDFDLIKAECARHDHQCPPNLVSHINLKKLYSRAYGTKPSLGLKEAMRRLSLSFEGTMHRGIDDARNIARLAQNVLMLDS